MLTLIDYLFQGLWGSKAFVSEYFIPDELIGKRANFLGAYITDMILTWDPTEGSQDLSEDFIKVLVKMLTRYSHEKKTIIDLKIM